MTGGEGRSRKLDDGRYAYTDKMQQSQSQLLVRGEE